MHTDWYSYGFGSALAFGDIKFTPTCPLVGKPLPRQQKINPFLCENLLFSSKTWLSS